MVGAQRELHSALVNTLLLVDDESSQLDNEADSLAYQLITVTNAMQAYVVDRVEVEVAGLPRIEAQQRLEPLLKLVRQAEPLLNELLASIADGNSSAKIMRRLYKQKGLHRIVLRLLRSVPVDYHEITAPLCYTALAGLCDCDHDVQTDLADNIDVLYSHFESLPKQVKPAAPTSFCMLCSQECGSRKSPLLTVIHFSAFGALHPQTAGLLNFDACLASATGFDAPLGHLCGQRRPVLPH